MKNILIGNAWPYANYYLHIGHIAAMLPGDIIARYYRLKGDNVVFVSGTDSHGTPITERAKKEGKKPNEIANFYHEEFIKSFNKIGISYDLYTTTDDDYHKTKVQEYFKKLIDNGYIYESLEEQDYCLICDKFLSDREIVGTCIHCGGEAKGDQCEKCFSTLGPDDLINRHCSTCGKEPVKKSNKHLYFKLSAFQDTIENLIDKNESIWRKNALQETKKFLKMGLIDRASTRQLDWGIDVPVEGYEDKRIYVWFEAVLGYVTTCERVLESKGLSFKDFIEDKNLTSYYCIGKDNIPFHSIIYPALLKGIDKNFALPSYIISCEYINMNDEKMSKSKGNLITVNDLVDTYGKDTSRYYLIANGPEKKDTNFTKEDLIQAHNKFLVGVLGNFVNRNFSFINKKFDGLITEGNVDKTIKELTVNTYKEVSNLIENGELKKAIETVFDYIVAGNKYYDESKPWVLVKDDINSFNDVTYTCCYMIANISNLLDPFIPDTCDKIKDMLNIKEKSFKEINLKGNIKLNNVQLLFERKDLI